MNTFEQRTDNILNEWKERCAPYLPPFTESILRILIADALALAAIDGCHDSYVYKEAENRIIGQLPVVVGLEDASNAQLNAPTSVQDDRKEQTVPDEMQ